MTALPTHRIRVFATLAALGLAAGCVFTVPTNPDAYPAALGDFPSVASGTSVEIVNGFDRSYMARMGNNQQADLQQFTQTAVVVLGRALTQRGASLAAGGKKIVLEATGPTISQGFGFVRTSITIDVKLGEKKLSVWGEGTGVDVSRDFSQAITRAVEELLRKPELREYLAAP